MDAIVVDSLYKKYNGKAAVNGISFSVPKGTIFGFLGPNGAGKTTTINILCTLLQPTSGRVTVNGFDSLKQPDLVRKSIGIVFQDTTLDKDLTAYENLLFHAYLYGVEHEKRKVEEALRFVDLFERKNELVRKFSGGMKRRLEVARAIVHQPELLFLDEPTLGLDPQSRDNLWSFVRMLPVEQGITVFMTTHYMDEAEVCDNICVIDKGKIIAQGSPAELKAGVGGDTIFIKTKDNKEAGRFLEEKMGIVPTVSDDELYFSADEAETCVPEIIRAFGELIISVRLQKPTLNDVFLVLTGRMIRDSSLDNLDSIREDIRAYRRRFDK